MHSFARRLTIAALFVFVASAQPQRQQNLDQVFHFANTETVRGFQEIATVMRTLVGIRELSLDIPQKAMVVHGTAGQIALAEWLFSQLDASGSGQGPATQNQNSGTHDYRVPGTSDDVAHVFYLTHADTVQGAQEIVTTIRKTIDIRRVFFCSASRALALRGTVDQVARAERLIQETDKPTVR